MSTYVPIKSVCGAVTTTIDIYDIENVEADNYDEAIDQFDFKLKYGNINRSDVYVADIEEK